MCRIFDFLVMLVGLKVVSSDTEDDGESCGRGILSKETIGEGELLLTIPLDICLTRKVAQVIHEAITFLFNAKFTLQFSISFKRKFLVKR